MALSLQMCAVPAEDCSGVYIFDKTGAYDAGTNTGGYGAPNPAVTDFTVATVSILFPGSTVPVVVNVYTGDPSTGLPTSNTAKAFLINTSTAEIVAAGYTSFPSGIYTFTYNIQGTFLAAPVSYSVSKTIVIDCELWCCVNKKIIAAGKKIANGSCNCNDDCTINAIFLATALEAAEKAACCGNVTDSNNLFDYVNDKCSSGGCGCS